MAKVSKKGWLIAGVGLGILLLAVPAIFCHRIDARWGINARISLLSGPDLEKRLNLLGASGVKWLREDYFFGGREYEQQSGNFAIARGKNFRILSLIPYGIGKKPTQPEDQLTEDLRDVFQAAKTWSEKSSPGVDAWELYNEADVGFCRDLPDRSTAYSKAIYLGLKAGGLSTPKPVIMGALALPPGPWVQRAAKNGLLDYVDAYNFHYYGHPEDFPAVLAAHRDFIRQIVDRPLPIWITECGYATEDDASGHEKQADYFKKILPLVHDGKVASFMPYALRDPGGFSLLNREGEALPAWTFFSTWARAHEVPCSPAFLKRKSPSAVICQWLPQSGNFIPHKVSGTYRFRIVPGSPNPHAMTGEIRIYNLGEQPVSGTLEIEGLQTIRVQADFPKTIEIPARGLVSFPVIFEAASRSYVQEWCRVRFLQNGKLLSDAYFGLETNPDEESFVASALDFSSGQKNSEKPFQYINEPDPYTISSTVGHWVGLNGLKLAGSDQALTIGPVEKGFGNAPPMAVALLKGLSTEGFLKLKSDVVFDPGFYVRVDLIDKLGQRFTIFENSGMSYFEKKKEVWLNLKDFHLYFWGRCVNPLFDPAAVREIQIRPYMKKEGQQATLSVEVMTSKKSADQ